MEEKVRQVLADDHVANISTLECIAPVADCMDDIDTFISWINHWICFITPCLIVHLPGVSFDEFEARELMHPIQFFNPSLAKGQPFCYVHAETLTLWL